MSTASIRRVAKELKDLANKPIREFTLVPLESNMLEVHFTMVGPEDSPYAGGLYHGRVVIPAEYPFAPPDVVLLTPNGRFEVGKKVCLSVSSYHPEHWKATWGIGTILHSLRSFMLTAGTSGIGSVNYPAEKRKEMAKESRSFVCKECGANVAEQWEEILKDAPPATDSDKGELLPPPPPTPPTVTPATPSPPPPPTPPHVSATTPLSPSVAPASNSSGEEEKSVKEEVIGQGVAVLGGGSGKDLVNATTSPPHTLELKNHEVKGDVAVISSSSNNEKKKEEERSGNRDGGTRGPAPSSPTPPPLYLPTATTAEEFKGITSNTSNENADGEGDQKGTGRAPGTNAVNVEEEKTKVLAAGVTDKQQENKNALEVYGREAVVGLDGGADLVDHRTGAEGVPGNETKEESNGAKKQVEGEREKENQQQPNPQPQPAEERPADAVAVGAQPPEPRPPVVANRVRPDGFHLEIHVKDIDRALMISVSVFIAVLLKKALFDWPCSEYIYAYITSFSEVILRIFRTLFGGEAEALLGGHLG